MTEDQQLKLQSFLDGELGEKEAREVAVWVAGDTAAARLLKELRNTRQALSGFEAGSKVPESREFYWSKIEREIHRLEPEPVAAQTPSLAARLRRFLMPASAFAVIVVVCLFAGIEAGWFASANSPATEMTVSDPGTFTYYDYANKTTLVWLSYPAER